MSTSPYVPLQSLDTTGIYDRVEVSQAVTAKLREAGNHHDLQRSPAVPAIVKQWSICFPSALHGHR